MARRPDSDADAAAQLWKRLGDTRAGMLSVDGSRQHPQPMTHFADPDAGAIWFITSADTDLARAVGLGGEATFVYQSQKGDYHASIKGPLTVSESSTTLDRLWSPPVGAWFEKGRDDPKVTLLQLSPREAAVWASDTNPVLVGLKMLNAAMRDGSGEPDVGVHRVIDFTAAG
ncbi:pyridoxamine 5'-phosphate oxidase family protein [Leisingera daeponensis]|uniref:Pyridoxamine 5'-phosphate oxidase family protein n=1 Tax=Leisingera daeponensis TaxID=405746 RepID=A0ABS7NLJ7_9RHOB|nr:pyridoxamine 5'-phosphate oxidase family protein [Leisingera daeponensis]MBY6058704.1 pyridoxamine 5'-phosphate oxidase family protein [Leisingera daeponensis]MBY6141021.1 pyridoxamine 5'-phosphate oxidase family protein [Leisingera daeponensis]